MFGIRKLLFRRKKCTHKQWIQSLLATIFVAIIILLLPVLLLLWLLLYADGHDDFECQSKILFSTKFCFPPFSIYQGISETENLDSLNIC